MTAPLLFLAFSLAGSSADTSLHLARGTAVEIDTRAGDVVVRTGPSDLVTVRNGSAELDGGTLQVSGDRRGSGGGTLEVTLPAWARVDVSTVGGNLTFTDAPARLHAETVNGAIQLTGGTGTVELESVAGSVVVRDFRGTSLSIDATGGGVTVTNATGAITVENVNSNVTLRGIQSSRIDASTVNGAIEFEGPMTPTGDYQFTSQNGDVTLVLPADVSARMKVSTMNGGLQSPQIPATTTGMQDAADSGGERTFTAVFGGGAARVTIDVFNGNVIVKKKP